MLFRSGHIEAPDFYQNRYAYQRARFIFGGRGWVDPVKEANAAQIRMACGLSTLEKECAEQGEDYEEILDQQAIEFAMREERGLPQPSPQNDNQAKQPDPQDPEDDPDYIPGQDTQPGDDAPDDTPANKAPPPKPRKAPMKQPAKKPAKGTAK